MLYRSLGGDGYVVAEVGGTRIVGVYCSPNRPFVDLERLLEVGGLLNGRPLSPTVVMGDFIAKHWLWGSPVTDAREAAVSEWVWASGLMVLNRRSAYTCVRQRGDSVIDVAFVTPVVAHQVEG